MSDLIWYAFDRWPEKVQRTIGYQIIRAVDSIAANPAEGYGRYTPADRRVFYRYARGSFEETKAWLRKLIRRSILDEKETRYGRGIVYSFEFPVSSHKSRLPKEEKPHENTDCRG